MQLTLLYHYKMDKHNPSPDVITVAGEPVPLVIRRNAAALRMTVRLSPSHDRVILTLPRHGSVQAGLAFLQRKASWIAAHRAPLPSCALQEGAVIPVLGVARRIVRLGGRGVAHLGMEGEMQALVVYGDPAFTPRRVREFLARLLQAECLRLSTQYAQRLGVDAVSRRVTRVSVRPLASRWGSCTSGGALSFAWQLVFAPYTVLDYVVAHETAHLLEMNHQPSFWAHVAQVCPEYAVARDWLKFQGHRLHQYRSA